VPGKNSARLGQTARENLRMPSAGNAHGIMDAGSERNQPELMPFRI